MTSSAIDASDWWDVKREHGVLWCQGTVFEASNMLLLLIFLARIGVSLVAEMRTLLVVSTSNTWTDMRYDIRNESGRRSHLLLHTIFPFLFSSASFLLSSFR